MSPSATPLLRVEDLRIAYQGSQGRPDAVAVDGLSFEIHRGETLALVGESGCGKSTTGLALLRLLPASARIRARRLDFEGRGLLTLDERALRSVRGGGIGMVFQDALSALNPIMRVGDQVAEAVRLHRRCSAREARDEALALLERVRIPEAARRMREYPQRLSGGMRQRIVIAMALAGRPSLLVADEPTTALDVTIQAQILTLLRSLQRELDMGLLLITHDLGVVAEMADRVAVMRDGVCVESRPAAALYADPQHPYTRALLASRPGAAAIGAEWQAFA
ncbi:ATP-binding cassette domain-containing protein [Orrella dioscoreae]|uniref:Oligopeptide transport ATP-binding protein OppD (TC 3.A.1.5.1) n=1 Tax=Orrella dioscoreae TaxID=1851544 RepID=A0A1C3JYC7_9BURK|nr:ABC transporter ATP-binding protein [Orrella dioscoreae]SBT24292.1 Oligopeptide transport ATP-binding protein OppD (TC 3.A.1.5.1) [Orrella dioscoreae]SOE49843.1 Oligopeptide transport ATP-binding protein OppD (TC 3.A.1.5.1) [Orrella dioscoreae]